MLSLERESPNEVLVSKYGWDEIPSGATVGTSSIRREAFCNYHNKDFNIKPIRGNIDTRIKKVLSGEYDATIMAEAGLKRLGLTEYIKQRFSIEYFTPAAGQGAIAVVARNDSDKRNILEKLNHTPSFPRSYRREKGSSRVRGGLSVAFRCFCEDKGE